MTEHFVTLRRALHALGPYRDDLVIVGAWAHRLFDRHPLARPLPYRPLATDDADLATPLRLATKGATIPKRLEAAGFETQLIGAPGLDTEPAMRFVEKGGAFYVELIAPLIGGREDRQGTPKQLVKVGGATAQLLRWVELLLLEPWTVDLGDRLTAQVANPASYLLQKMLTRREASGGAKAPKDLLYVYDTLTIFGPRLAGLAPLGRRMLAKIPAKTEIEFRQMIAAGPASGAAIAAAEIAASTGRQSPPAAARIALVCRMGLAQVFPVIA